MRSVKPYKTTQEHIQELRRRGMHLDDAQATQWLRTVGYYRLSGYWYPCRDYSGSDTEIFYPNTEFAHIADLYEFDRKLRTLIHDALERVEIAMRNALVEELGPLSPEAMYHPDTFSTSREKYYEVLFTVQNKVKRAYGRGRREGDISVQHNLNHYGPHLSIWVLVSTLDFSDLSKIYALLDIQSQTRVAKMLGVDTTTIDLRTRQRGGSRRRGHPFESWLRQLTLVRNKCAHHGRLWNTEVIPASSASLRGIAGLETLPSEQSTRIYGVLLMLAKILETVSPGSSWASKVRLLVHEHEVRNPCIRYPSMGFPDGWATESIWNPGGNQE